MNKSYAIILAAGKGTRMKSDYPKVLSKLGEKPLLVHVIESTIKAGIHDITIVTGYKNDLVESVAKNACASQSKVKLNFVYQAEQKGTGHAVMVCRDSFSEISGSVIILLGDVPLIQPESIKEALIKTNKEMASSLVITMQQANPYGYGRIVKNKRGEIIKITEEKDANDHEKKITEVNTGVFVFQTNDLWPALEKLGTSNSQNEYYLTDTVSILTNSQKKVIAWQCPQSEQFVGINSPEQLKSIEAQYAHSLN